MKYKNRSSNYFQWFLDRPRATGFLFFLILSMGVSFMIYQRIQIINKNMNSEMQTTLENLHQNIDQNLKNCNATTLTLALTINDNGIPENFESISSQLLNSNKCINAVQLVPDGIIKYIYPLKENEFALNLNILNSAHLKKEALKSIKTKKMYFAGPLHLKQGGIGIVGRLPIFKKNKFWGFSAVVIKLDTLLRISGVKTIDTNKYYFQFSKINPNTFKEDFFLPISSNINKNEQISTRIPEGNWKLYLINKKTNNNYSVLYLPSILGFTLAILFGILLTIILNRPKRLQQLLDIQEAMLLNSEMKFKTIFDQAPVGIALVKNDTGDFIEINNKFCDLIGYTEQEMKLKNYHSITHPKDLIVSESVTNELNNEKKADYNLKKRYITKTGKTVWANLIVSSLYTVNENLNTNIAIIEDITLQKQIQDDLRDSEKQFKSLFKNSPIPLWEVDLSLVKNYLNDLNLINKDQTFVSGYFEDHPEVVNKCFTLVKIIGVNYKCLELLNIKSKQILASNLEQVLDETTLKNFQNQLLAITQNNDQLAYDSKIKNSNGESIDIHFRWNAIKGHEKTMDRMIISTEDITFRKKHEKLIMASQEKVESLINTIDGIVWECSIETFSFTFVSKKVEEILGYTSEEWLSDPNFWQNHIHPEDKAWALEYCTTKSKDLANHDFEYRMICKDGSVIWMRDMVNVVFQNGKAVSLHGIMIDITKSKNIENDLNNSFSLVSKQNERLLNFSYIISHNLRSHTSNIASIVSLIKDAETEQEKKQLMDLLVSVSDLLNETMVHLNEVINIRTNINLATESLNLSECIDNVMKVFSKQILSKEVIITNLIPKDLVINYNPAYLESILYNLISNAIRFSHSERKPNIHLEWIPKKNKNILKISDNGIGIDLEKYGNKIFGLYKTFTNDKRSKGVGLFITKNQIEAMGGTITVQSEENQGTIFKIEIL
ncbi:PAS domain S-box protein [Flavobacterium sp. WC2509]|uniref:PAS domain S-box protein n=1 Tax=Flavobacterium sp. WC2509 TaxID=3461406 RepID=UPI004043FE92